MAAPLDPGLFIGIRYPRGFARRYSFRSLSRRVVKIMSMTVHMISRPPLQLNGWCILHSSRNVMRHIIAALTDKEM
jgi:hypothetical protein